MNDGIQKNTGNSRFLRSVPNFLSQYPTYEDFAAALVAGTLPIDLNGLNSAGWTQLPTMLNKANLLSDTTAAALGGVNTPNEAFMKVILPAGVIVMWSGAANAIPSGWALCNGSNGTPDLRNRFIVGAGNTYAVGATGGEATHTLTVNEIPAHSHSVTATNSGTTEMNNAFELFTRAGNAGSRSTKTSGSGAAHNNLPPYYALCYIMKL